MVVKAAKAAGNFFVFVLWTYGDVVVDLSCSCVCYTGAFSNCIYVLRLTLGKDTAGETKQVIALVFSTSQRMRW